jgi:hypothetical protein
VLLLRCNLDVWLLLLSSSCVGSLPLSRSLMYAHSSNMDVCVAVYQQLNLKHELL